MADIKKCIIGKIGKDTLTESQIDKLITDLESSAKSKALRDGVGFEEALRDAHFRQKFDNQVGKLQKQRGILLNQRIERGLYQKLADLKTEGLSDHKAAQAIIGGVASNAKSGRFSVDAQWKAALGQYVGSLIGRFERKGLMSFVQDKSMELPIAQEYANLTSKNPVLTNNPPQAREIAKEIFTVMEGLRIARNQAGAYIRTLDGFHGVQYHNSRRIEKTGFEQWKRDVSSKLDFDKMGVPLSEADEYLSHAFKKIIGGEQYSFGGLNLARKVSEARELHFKSPKDWLEYNDLYGNGSYMESIVYSIERSTRDLVMMKNFGTNPQVMWDKITSHLSADAKKAVDNIYKEIDGSLVSPVNPTLAAVGSLVRAYEITTKLGSALFSYVVDTPTKAIELQKNGLGFFDSYATTIADLFSNMNDEARRAVSDAFGVGFEGQIGAIGNNFFSIDGLPGASAKIIRLFFKLNLQDWWTNKNKIGTTVALSHFHAKNKNLEFGQLPFDTRNVFGQYGIGEAEWNTIRQSAQKVGEREYIMPDTIADKTVSEKFRAYLVDRVDFATLTPGARERAIFNRGIQRGTPEGELLRLMMQFKSFPITFISKVWGRALYGSGKADIPQMMQMVIAVTTMGYAAEVIRSAAKGRTPPDPTKTDVIINAFLKGGAGGIFGDMTFGYINSSRDSSWTDTLVGPALSDLNSWLALAKEGGDVDSKVLDRIIKSTPGNNLFYLRPILDYIFLNQLQEMARPGYANRLKDYYRVNRGQEFMSFPMADPNRTLAEDLRQ